MTGPEELPRHLRLLWALPGARRGPRPRQTIQGIGAAAVALADAQGLAAVSMKAVAEALGMTTMSLYRYLDAKEHLFEVMLDQAYGPPAAVEEPADGAGWRDRLAAWAHALAGALLAHPWIVEVPMTSPPTTPSVLGWTDRGVAAFAGTGLDGQQRLSSLLLVDGFVRQHVRLSLQLGLAPTSSPGGADDATGGAVYATRLAQLVDPARLPHLAEASSALEDDGDFYTEELEFGLGVLLDGIAALVERASRAR